MLVVLQLGDRELEVLDLGVEVVDFQRSRDQQRFQRGDIIGACASLLCSGAQARYADDSCFAAMSNRGAEIIP